MYKAIVKPTLTLTLIAVIVGALLALTYHVTGVGNASTGIAPDKLAEYQPIVLPSASKLVQADVHSETAGFLGAYIDEGAAGCAINISAKGYHGNDSLNLLIGFDKNGAISGIHAISTQETPGVGTKATEQDYLKSYIGKNAPVTVSKDGSGDIDAIANATISSNAVADAVNQAFAVYEELKGELEL